MNGTPVAARQLKKSDTVAILIIGEVFAILLLILRRSLDIDYVPQVVLYVLPVIMPFAALACLWGAAVLGRKRPFIFQLGKYAAVGFMNTAVDFVIINLLIFWTGIVAGLKLGFLNSISFTIAVVNSYFWNKYWTFSGTKKGGVSKTEFLQFIIVSLVALFLNSGFVAAMTKYIHPPFGLDPQQWVNLVKVFGIFISLAWNFAGYKFIVFRQKGSNSETATAIL